LFLNKNEGEFMLGCNRRKVGIGLIVLASLEAYAGFLVMLAGGTNESLNAVGKGAPLGLSEDEQHEFMFIGGGLMAASLLTCASMGLYSYRNPIQSAQVQPTSGSNPGITAVAAPSQDEKDSTAAPTEP
jgi:hypothetical protein